MLNPPNLSTPSIQEQIQDNHQEDQEASQEFAKSELTPLDDNTFEPDDDFTRFIETGKWGNEPEINKIGEKKEDTKSPEELEKLKELEELEKLKKLEGLTLLEKEKKFEELTTEITTIPEKIVNFFKNLSNEIKKPIAQIAQEYKKISKALGKSKEISEIISKIEDPKNYKKFAEDKTKPIKEIITEVLAEDKKIKAQFDEILEGYPDLIEKIIIPILKENAIKRIKTQIEVEKSKVSSSSKEGDDAILKKTTEDEKIFEDAYDTFRKIITQILEEDSLITRFYKQNHYSVSETIHQLQFEKADENPIEKLTNRIRDENGKVFEAIAKDPLVEIIFAHKKEASQKIPYEKIPYEIEEKDSPQTAKASGETETKVISKKDKPKIYSPIPIEIVEAKILQTYQAILPTADPEQTKKTSLLSRLLSRLFSTKTLIKAPKNTFDQVKSDIVFAVPNEDKLKKKIEDLATKEKEGEDLDEKKLLLYAKLIDKIPEQYSESITSVHQEIVNLKKQEKDHKKTLDSLKNLIEKERIAKAKQINEELAQIKLDTNQLSAELNREIIREQQKIAEENQKIFEEKEIEAAKEEENKVTKILRDFENLITQFQISTLEEQKIQITRNLFANSTDSSQKKIFIENRIREILSIEYIDQRLASDPEKSIMPQLVKEAVIVDEAINRLTHEEIQNIKQHQSDNISLEPFNLLIIKKALKKVFEEEHENMGLGKIDTEINIEVTAIDTPQNINNFFKRSNNLHISFSELRRLEDEGENLNARLALIETELKKKSAPLASKSSSTSLEDENASCVDTQLATLRGEGFAKVDVQLLEQKISSSNDGILDLQDLAGRPIVETPYNQALEPKPPQTFQNQIASAEEYKDPETPPPPPPLLETLHHEPWEKLGSLPPQNDPPLPSQNQFQASSTITSLGLNEVVENAPPTILRTEIEKIGFLKNFISTRLISTPRYSNNIQSSRRTIDAQEELIKDQLNQTQSSLTISESDNGIVLPNTISSISYLTSEIDEIEKRKKGLYTILKANLEKQIIGNPNEEIIDEPRAIENIEFLMDYIANLTLRLASILNQEGGSVLYDDSYFQGIQNSTKHDPIIYSGVGIRIKLEMENGECFLNITDVFENSDLDKNYKNKKITQIECEGELKSISEIYRECKNDNEKFYTKIAVIFRDPNKETLKLKINDETKERDVKKNIFIPSQRNIFNISDNSQLTTIADQINAIRANQNSTPLYSPRHNTEAAI